MKRARKKKEPTAPSLTEALDRIYHRLAGASAAAQSEEARRPGSVQSREPCVTLQQLRTVFDLTPFEFDVLVLCAGASLESRFHAACAAAHNDPRATWPTFGLALSVLADPHWSAISRTRPLRYWRLIEPGAGPVLHAPLQIDERVLQYILGVPTMDGRLEALVRPVAAPRDGTSPTRRHNHAVMLGADHWRKSPPARQPILLVGRQASARQAVFAEICRQTGFNAYLIGAADIPSAIGEREEFARLWTRAGSRGSGMRRTPSSSQKGLPSRASCTRIASSSAPSRKRTAIVSPRSTREWTRRSCGRACPRPRW